MNPFTPGKVILSGEHAIVHGRPAIAAAVRAGVHGTFTPLTEPEIRIHADALPSVQAPLSDLPGCLAAIRSRHQAFLAGTLPVSKILNAPSELLLAAAALARPTEGVQIHLTSTLPLGSGLGSSAAVILTLLKGLLPTPTPKTLYPLALECEHFQHGRSSGLDVATCLAASWIFASHGKFESFDPPPTCPLFRLYFTGKPDSTTGECVSLVAKNHPSSDPIWDLFQEATLAIRQALLDTSPLPFREVIRENHRLLSHIGVVPAPIARAIKHIEQADGAAKICGAGSIRGDRAGIVLVTGPDNLPLPESWQPLNVL